MPADPTRGLLDTNLVILRRGIDPADLPDEFAISAITLAELSGGVHLVTRDDAAAIEERARRADLLQRTENEFDPIPFETEAFAHSDASAPQSMHARSADLMIASTAAAAQLPPYNTNPADFDGLEAMIRVVAVRRLS